MKHTTDEKKIFDVIVIGGGPAGLFAAGFAARQGAKVLLLEKMPRCGAKVLITGKGRCNVTHNEEDPRKFVEAFGRNGRALLTAFYAFGVKEVECGAGSDYVLSQEWPEVEGGGSDLTGALQHAAEILGGEPGRVLIATDGAAGAEGQIGRTIAGLKDCADRCRRGVRLSGGRPDR